MDRYDFRFGGRRGFGLWRLLAALLLGLAAHDARANCTVSAGSVVFGSYDVFSVQPLDGAGSIGIDCDPATPYSISLGTGGGSYGQRELASGGDSLGYNLYTGATRVVVWGDGSGGTGTVGGSTAQASHTVYGRIPAGQNVPAGSYGDTIIVTVSF